MTIKINANNPVGTIAGMSVDQGQRPGGGKMEAIRKFLQPPHFYERDLPVIIIGDLNDALRIALKGFEEQVTVLSPEDYRRSSGNVESRP